MAAKNTPLDECKVVCRGRSTVVCSCGWNLTRRELCPSAEEDRVALEEEHARHVIRRARGET